MRFVVKLWDLYKFLRPLIGTLKLKTLQKLLLGLDYAEFLTDKEDEIEEFILSFIVNVWHNVLLRLQNVMILSMRL